MITLTSWSDLAELLDLMHEMTADGGMGDEAAFVAACAEMPVLLELGSDARYSPSRIVWFDASGQPATMPDFMTDERESC